MAGHLLACAMVLLLALLTPHYSRLVARPLPRTLGTTEEEDGGRFLVRALPEGSNVATYALLPAMMARMRYMPIHADAA